MMKIAKIPKLPSPKYLRLGEARFYLVSLEPRDGIYEKIWPEIWAIMLGKML